MREKKINSSIKTYLTRKNPKCTKYALNFSNELKGMILFVTQIANVTVHSF